MVMLVRNPAVSTALLEKIELSCVTKKTEHVKNVAACLNGGGLIVFRRVIQTVSQMDKEIGLVIMKRAPARWDAKMSFGVTCVINPAVIPVSLVAVIGIPHVCLIARLVVMVSRVSDPVIRHVMTVLVAGIRVFVTSVINLLINRLICVEQQVSRKIISFLVILLVSLKCFLL